MTQLYPHTTAAGTMHAKASAAKRLRSNAYRERSSPYQETALIVILRTNKQLLNPMLDRRSAETEAVLARWGRLHAVRSILSALALLLFLYLAIFREAL